MTNPITVTGEREAITSHRVTSSNPLKGIISDVGLANFVLWLAPRIDGFDETQVAALTAIEVNAMNNNERILKSGTNAEKASVKARLISATTSMMNPNAAPASHDTSYNAYLGAGWSEIVMWQSEGEKNGDERRHLITDITTAVTMLSARIIKNNPDIAGAIATAINGSVIDSVLQNHGTMLGDNALIALREPMAAALRTRNSTKAG